MDSYTVSTAPAGVKVTYANEPERKAVEPRIEYVIRGFREEDRQFIGDSWIQSLKGASRESRATEPGPFFKHYIEQVTNALNKCTVKIAAPPGDDFTVYGFAVYEPGVVHMVYVKKPFRRMGFSRLLLKEFNSESATFPHWTRDVGDWIFERYGFHGTSRPSGLRYDRFLHERKESK